MGIGKKYLEGLGCAESEPCALLGNLVLHLGKQFDGFLQPSAYQVTRPLSWVFTP